MFLLNGFLLTKCFCFKTDKIFFLYIVLLTNSAESFIYNYAYV